MGYGAKALSDLISFYEGKFASLSETGLEEETSIVRVTDAELENGTLKDEITVRDIATLPPLFSKLSECRPSAIEYVGVSYGLTQPLHKFWRKSKSFNTFKKCAFGFTAFWKRGVRKRDYLYCRCYLKIVQFQLGPFC